jgi:hypothetical protein
LKTQLVDLVVELHGRVLGRNTLTLARNDITHHVVLILDDEDRLDVDLKQFDFHADMYQDQQKTQPSGWVFVFG